jgi:hypothetical protein
MSNPVICEICGTTFSQHDDDLDVCYSCRKPAKTVRKKPSVKCLDNRKTAKFFGGKALKGTVKQKEWAEKIRTEFLESGSVSDEVKVELMQCGGFVDSASFWIDNRNTAKSALNVRNIVTKYQELLAFEAKHREFLARTNPAFEKDKRRNEIRNFLKNCDVVLKSSLVE